MPKVVITIDIDVVEEEEPKTVVEENAGHELPFREEDYISAREYMETTSKATLAQVVGKDMTQRAKKYGIPIRRKGGKNYYHRSILDY